MCCIVHVLQWSLTLMCILQYTFLKYFFFCLCSSDGENGTDGKRKAGKSPTVLLQTSANEMEYFDDRKKLDVAR